MLRWLATVAIVALLALDLFIPRTSIGRRGTEARARTDVAEAFAGLGEPLPALDLRTLAGERLDLADLRGHRVLLTFERSVDW